MVSVVDSMLILLELYCLIVGLYRWHRKQIKLILVETEHAIESCLDCHDTPLA
jgi:hypothetical protein